MNILIAVVSLFGAAAVIMAVGLTGIVTGWLKALVVALAVLINVYCMARIPVKETKAEKKETAKARAGVTSVLLERQGTGA